MTDSGDETPPAPPTPPTPPTAPTPPVPPRYDPGLGTSGPPPGVPPSYAGPSDTIPPGPPPGASYDGFALAPDRFRPQLEIDGPLRQRRWTVLLRLLLVLPLVVVGLFVAIAQFVVLLCAWFGALALGRSPHWAARFNMALIPWQTRVQGYAFLVTDRYPGLPFRERPDERIRVELAAERVNRAAVFFRFVLAIPANLVQTGFQFAWGVLAFIFWLVVLINGSMPAGLFDVTAALMRLALRQQAYIALLTDAYPLQGTLGDRLALGSPPPPPAHLRLRTRPLLLTGGEKAAVVTMIVVGLAANVLVQAIAPAPRQPNHSPGPQRYTNASGRLHTR